MGEEKQRRELGLVPKLLKPGEQVQVDIKNATPKFCECGCKFFIPVVAAFTVSALVSPTGQELLAQQAVLVCMKCSSPLNPS